MEAKINSSGKKRGCLPAFLIIIGSLTVFAVFLGIFIFIFSADATHKEVQAKNTLYHIESDLLFNEKLLFKDDYDKDDTTAKYTALFQNLAGTYSIRTRDYDFTFRKGMREVHVIPVINNKTNSEKRKIYDIKFGGPTTGHLAFGLKDKYGKPGLVDFQFDSRTNSEKILVVKYLFNNAKYCQRGVAYDVLEHTGDAF
ncbi:hypothetical protein [Chryseobacterium sp.]|jgi:hypothetical protein|uniref:hypothetical protein n=1 Tax=Chryseobacterium sp. TaxID=1871047 RepID=UPI00284CB7B5|nr:hypothetical protein [Chryseobacterium sp.]MDR3025573.1 hypothetical protein [Chryseobacterium sp.]